MELGQRLKQARLEAGLSQRQLCGEEITRNMLSLIENGSARPSMDTLRYLAAKLGKPMGYFLEEQAITSPNQEIMEKARQAIPEETLQLLKSYRAPDPVFDWERYLLEVLACLALADNALADDRIGYAADLLNQAASAGSQTPYYTPDLERRRLLLCYQAKAIPPQEAVALLPDHTQELLLRGTAALESGDPSRCGEILDAADNRDSTWYLLRGEAFLQQKAYAAAVEQYRKAGDDPRIYAKLEHCYRELEDFKMAYFYACKQR